jgi:hypothetical protein
MVPIIVSWLYALMQLTTPLVQDEQEKTDSLLTMKQRPFPSIPLAKVFAAKAPTKAPKRRLACST